MKTQIILFALIYLSVTQSCLEEESLIDGSCQKNTQSTDTFQISDILVQPLIKLSGDIHLLDNLFKPQLESETVKQAQNVQSYLTFCQDAECVETTNQPSGQLFINRQFYVQHLIDDKSLFIESPQVTFKSPDFEFKLLENDFDIIKKALGQNVYKVRVPLASDNVHISVNAQTSDGQLIITGVKIGDAENKNGTTEEKVSQVTNPTVEIQQNTISNSIQINDGASFISPQLDMDQKGSKQLYEEPVFIQDASNDRLKKVQTDNLKYTPTSKSPMTSFGGSNNIEDKTQTDQPNLKCKTDSQFLYNGNCIEKSCLFKKLQRVRMTPLQNFSNDSKILQDHIANQVEYVDGGNEGRVYRIRLAYGDEKSNQIVSEPEECIDWRIYQTKNQYDIDQTRIMPIDAIEGTKPDWPIVTYQYVDDIQAGELTFDVTQTDLNDKKCLKFSHEYQIAYECFFEFALVVQHTTQISYYFSLKVILNSNDFNDIKLLDVAITHVSQ